MTNFSHCEAGDAEIAQAKTETNQAKQIELWQTAQKKIMENVCSVPMVESRLSWARRDTLDWGYELKGAIATGPVLTEATHFTE